MVMVSVMVMDSVIPVSAMADTTAVLLEIITVSVMDTLLLLFMLMLRYQLPMVSTVDMDCITEKLRC